MKVSSAENMHSSTRLLSTHGHSFAEDFKTICTIQKSHQQDKFTVQCLVDNIQSSIRFVTTQIPLFTKEFKMICTRQRSHKTMHLRCLISFGLTPESVPMHQWQILLHYLTRDNLYPQCISCLEASTKNAIVRMVWVLLSWIPTIKVNSKTSLSLSAPSSLPTLEVNCTAQLSPKDLRLIHKTTRLSYPLSKCTATFSSERDQ